MGAPHDHGSDGTATAAGLEALGELIAVVGRLRDPQTGCPWDLEQTHASLVPYVLEEAHEVADAIRHGDNAHLKEELGDLLLQVVLHARIAEEEGRLDVESQRSLSLASIHDVLRDFDALHAHFTTGERREFLHERVVHEKQRL